MLLGISAVVGGYYQFLVDADHPLYKVPLFLLNDANLHDPKGFRKEPSRVFRYT